MAGSLSATDSLPSVTLGISTLDRAQLLEDTLEALSGVELGPTRELVIVDQSVEPFDIEPWRNRFPVPLYLIHQRARGLSPSRNEVIRKSTSSVILFLDDDVVPDRDLVMEHARTYTEDPAIIGVAGGERIPPERDSSRTRRAARRLLTWALRPYWNRSAYYRRFLDHTGHPVALITGWGVFLCDFSRPHACDVMTPRGCNMSFRRDALLQVGGFDPAFVGPRRDESDLSLRLLESLPGSRIVFNPRATVLHRMASSGGVRALGADAHLRCEIEFARRHLSRWGYLFFALLWSLSHPAWMARHPRLLRELWRARPAVDCEPPAGPSPC